MKVIPLLLRENILSVYDAGQSTQLKVAQRFCASLDFVKKLIAQRKHTGSIAPKRPSGRPPKITDSQRNAIKTIVEQSPDTTLQLPCTTANIHHILRRMGLFSSA